MITIGYGLAIPVNVGEVWMVLASMLTGAMMYAVLLGMINSMMQSMDRSGSMYVERMQMWKVSGWEGEGAVGVRLSTPKAPSTTAKGGMKKQNWQADCFVALLCDLP